MERAAEREEVINVVISAAIVSAAIVVFSVAFVYIITGDAYLGASYTLESLFLAPEQDAATSLAQIAESLGGYTFASIVGVVIVDTVGEMVVISFLIATVLDFVRYSNVENFLNRMKSRRMRSHIIICGYNSMAEDMAGRLVSSGKKFVVIDPNEGVVNDLNSRHVPAVVGNYTDRRELADVAAGSATTIMFLSDNDMYNLIGAVAAKSVNTKIRVFARATRAEIRTKMHRAGVEMCVLPEEVAGIEMGNQIARIMG